MTSVYHCNTCNHAYQLTLGYVYCMHKENYAKPVDDYQIETDAGNSCPLNKANPDYIPYSVQIDKEGITCVLKDCEELHDSYPCRNTLHYTEEK